MWGRKSAADGILLRRSAHSAVPLLARAQAAERDVPKATVCRNPHGHTINRAQLCRVILGGVNSELRTLMVPAPLMATLHGKEQLFSWRSSETLQDAVVRLGVPRPAAGVWTAGMARRLGSAGRHGRIVQTRGTVPAPCMPPSGGRQRRKDSRGR